MPGSRRLKQPPWPNIYYREGVSAVMERVPRAEEVVALIRNTLLQSQGQPRSGEGAVAEPGAAPNRGPR
jgi:hypothetical protein